MRTPFELPDYEQSSTEPTPPVEILREAATALTTKTGGRVEGSVFTGGLGGIGSYRHTFYLRAPSLDDFTDPLFYVWHGPELYPARVLMAGDKQGNARSFTDESTLHDEVQRLLTSPIAHQRIGAMLAQVNNRPVGGRS